MDALSRLFAVLTVSFTVGGVTSLTETAVVKHTTDGYRRSERSTARLAGF
jgi:hypothetical protein